MAAAVQPAARTGKRRDAVRVTVVNAQEPGGHGRAVQLLAGRLKALGRDGGAVAVVGTGLTGIEPAAELNGGPGLVFSGPDRVIATMAFDFDAQGRITAIHNVANPDKLRAVAEGIAYGIGGTAALTLTLTLTFTLARSGRKPAAPRRLPRLPVRRLQDR